MPIDQTPEQLNSLLRELCRLTKGTEYFSYIQLSELQV